VALIAGGATKRHIADALVISEGTATVHVKHILRKLDLHSRAQAAAWAVGHGLARTPRT
jgi:two-component system nitrate/nitrite response regulator NarL